VPAAFLTGDAQRRDLGESPIDADWILDGAPVARSTQLTEEDGVSTYLWDCTAGRFHWHFGVDEIVHILEGAVHVTGDDGHTVTLRTGDVGHFPLGSHAIWHVEEYVRKLAVHRAPRPAALPVRAARRLRHDARLRLVALAGAATAAIPVAATTPW
jgi:uncharacterized protein